ncbi:MAG: hypothetical protein Q9218_006119 [Villophora microphyllina]
MLLSIAYEPGDSSRRYIFACNQGDRLKEESFPPFGMLAPILLGPDMTEACKLKQEKGSSSIGIVNE